jgi:hypothetical protein
MDRIRDEAHCRSLRLRFGRPAPIAQILGTNQSLIDIKVFLGCQTRVERLTTELHASLSVGEELPWSVPIER